MLTIVIASYQYGHLAAHCIESVLSQTQAPEQIYFVDDGANDCRHLSDLYPEVEFFFREKTLGTVKNFQDMLMRVKSEYVMFLGADNWLRSDAVERLSQTKSDIVTYDIVVTGELKTEMQERTPGQISGFQGDYYWNRQGLHHGSMMYRTRIGKQFGYQSSSYLHPQEDWNLWDQMIQSGASVDSIKEGLLYYRRHRENFLKYSEEVNQQSMTRQLTDQASSLLSCV
jgi:glycosyltransferase involved in cell wall biosynthesis